MENVSQYARVNNVEQCESVCGFVCVCVRLCVCVWQVKVATLHSRQRHRHHRHRSWPHVAQSIFDGRAKIYGEKYIWLCTMNPRVGKLCKSYGAPIRPTAMSTSVASPSYAVPFPLHPLKPLLNCAKPTLAPTPKLGLLYKMYYIFLCTWTTTTTTRKEHNTFILLCIIFICCVFMTLGGVAVLAIAWYIWYPPTIKCRNIKVFSVDEEVGIRIL